MYTFEQATKLANEKAKQTGIYWTAEQCISKQFQGLWRITCRFNPFPVYED